MKENEKCCATCAWYAEFEGVCCNAKSDACADFVDSEYSCKHWERIGKPEE